MPTSDTQDWQQHSSFVEILRRWAQLQPEQRAYTFLVDGETTEVHLTYAELDCQARAIGGWLQEQGMQGERALLIYPQGLDFIAAFLGCLYAGVVAVPAYPPARNRPDPRRQAIVADTQTKQALTTAKVLSEVTSSFAHTPKLAALRWQASDDLPNGVEENWRDPAAAHHTLAFLQYTSGSTATPKGVMVSHGNLLHNSAFMKDVQENDATSVGGSWLPMFHDMGLIEGILCAGVCAVRFSAAGFLSGLWPCRSHAWGFKRAQKL